MAFPSSPSNDDLHTEFGRTFKYSSATNSWSSATPDAPEDNTPITQGYVDVQSLPLTGVAAGSKAFVQDGNKLFIFTGSGWFEIATINTAPTITSGADASYALNSDGTPTVITLQATDPEGTPIIWGYQVTSGSLEDTTVTNVGNVFTITPGTTEATFDLAFTASDGVNIDTSASSFTLSLRADWSSTVTKTHTLINPNVFGTVNNDRFGEAVATNGVYAAVAAWREDVTADYYVEVGVVYVYDAQVGVAAVPGSSPLYTIYNPNSQGRSDAFGFSLSMTDDYLFVGARGASENAGKVFIYELSTGTLVKTINSPSTDSYFGQSVAAFGNNLIVGAYRYSSYAGRAFLYKTINSSWSDATLAYTLDNPSTYSTATNDYFGEAVAIYGDYCVVAAPQEDRATSPTTDMGALYVYYVPTGNLVRTIPNVETNWSRLGEGLSISDTFIAARAGNYGVALYNLSNGAYIRSYTVAGFGSVAISDDYLFVGNNSAGSGGQLYIYDLNAADPTAIVKTLNNPNAYSTGTGDTFADKFSVSGKYVIVGAWNEKSSTGVGGSGAAYIFKAN